MTDSAFDAAFGAAGAVRDAHGARDAAPGATCDASDAAPDAATDAATPVRVRFAPSPTGNLHIGGARTAIYNWAFARHNNGSFILRIEDTDPERSTPENTAQIIRSLKWLGLDWDEGPEVGGDFGPYLQTQRFSTYRDALEKLKEKDAVYPCFCSADELAQKREAALAAKSYAGYDRSCRAIPREKAQARIDAGEPHTWRLKIPKERKDVSFEDLVFGTTIIPITQLDDFILMRTDGTPTYNYVVCVDDALMEISHVIRGDDHLSNTPKQILVYEALGVPVPRFAHLSMILGADSKRLSKRHGATSVESYRDAGYFPEALLNYLALLGWSLDGETTLFSRDTLVKNFTLSRISKNPATFDETKLAWVNASYLKTMGATAFVDALTPLLVERRLARAADVAAHRPWYEAIYPLVAERAKTMTEVIPMIGYLFGDDEVALDEKSVEKCLRVEGAAEALTRAAELLSDENLNWEAPTIEAVLRTIPDELGKKPKLVFQALRVAVCGNMVSPPLFESLELIGKPRVLIRIKHALPLTICV
ncbi:MAG: glutamate--tRNA ligase [Coriobacteriales bacterium]|jgi:glutamyl-tRNA synthetase|nr:glutamate--tRNA ligase [Coriobacteriales bacterium]